MGGGVEGEGGRERANWEMEWALNVKNYPSNVPPPTSPPPVSWLEFCCPEEIA